MIDVASNTTAGWSNKARSHLHTNNCTMASVRAVGPLTILWLLQIVDTTAWVFLRPSLVSSSSAYSAAAADRARATSSKDSSRSRIALMAIKTIRNSIYDGCDDLPISNSNNKEITSRRSFFSSSVPFCCAASTLCGIVSIVEEEDDEDSVSGFAAAAWAAPPVNDSSSYDEELQRKQKQLQEAFHDIQEELNGEVFTEMGKGGGVLFLKQLIVNEKWDTIKEFTKFYDAEFRKVKLGRARKLLTDKKLKEEALQLSNAITFDLIGINKSSRVQDGNEAIRYWTELEEDITKFLQLQNKV